MSVHERQKQTAQAFIDGYNTWTIEGLLARRSKNCVHKMRPASLQVPDQDNAQYEEQYRQLIPLLKDYKMTVLKLLNNPEAHTVVIHATGSAETVAGPYRNEYIFFLKMDDAGDELVEVEEHVDTAFIASWYPKIMEYLKATATDRKEDGLSGEAENN